MAVLLEPRSHRSTTLSDLLQHKFKLLYLGEVHEQDWLVKIHTEILQEACHSGRLGFLGVEYFNVEQQPLLDKWTKGNLSWEDLVEEYSKGPEGFNLNVYKPIFDTANKCGAPIIGLMLPRNKAQQISRSVIIPDIPEAAINPHDYPREYECLLVNLLPRTGPMSKIPVDRLILAQSYKDTIASWRVKQAYREHGSGVVIMGWVHVEAKGGVASRAASLLSLKRRDYIIVGARNERGWHPEAEKLLEECLETDYLLIRE